MQHFFRTLALVAVAAMALAVLAPKNATAGQPLVSIVYSANDFGEYHPCPT